VDGFSCLKAQTTWIHARMLLCPEVPGQVVSEEAAIIDSRTSTSNWSSPPGRSRCWFRREDLGIMSSVECLTDADTCASSNCSGCGSGGPDYLQSEGPAEAVMMVSGFARSGPLSLPFQWLLSSSQSVSTTGPVNRVSTAGVMDRPPLTVGPPEKWPPPRIAVPHS